MGSDRRSVARRAAGTQTMVDVLLHWTFIRRRTPEQDIEDFDNGQVLRVAGFTKGIGGPVMRSVGKGKSIALLRSGYLRLAVGEAPVWNDRRGDRTATLHPPFRLKLADGKLRMARKFERYELVAAEGTYDLAVPKVDGPLIRHVFATPEGS